MPLTPERIKQLGAQGFQVSKEGVLLKYKPRLGGDVEVPEGVTSIGEGAFSGSLCKDKEITSIILPPGVTSIMKKAFFRCGSVIAVHLPESLTSIGEEAFACCSKLVHVNFPTSLRSVGKYAFYMCTSLSPLLPFQGGLASIGEEAFSMCGSLVAVILPSSLTSIGKDPFGFFSDLKTVFCMPEQADLLNQSGVSLDGVQVHNSSPKLTVTLNLPGHMPARKCYDHRISRVQALRLSNDDRDAVIEVGAMVMLIEQRFSPQFPSELWHLIMSFLGYGSSEIEMVKFTCESYYSLFKAIKSCQPGQVRALALGSPP